MNPLGPAAGMNPGRRCVLFAATVIQFAIIGCHHTPRQAMSELWGAVPQVRWSGSRVDPTSQPEKAEPSVSANVAMSAGSSKVDSTDDEMMSPDSTAQVGGKDTENSGSNSIQPAAGFNDRAGSELSASDFSDADRGEEKRDLSSDPAMADSSADQIQRLKAALNDDAERARLPPTHVGGAHDVRVRVESMLAKSRRLFDLGQLREARHAAKIAHDLGDSARLDYSPDEERPIDLVQRIDDQLREAEESTTTPDEPTRPDDSGSLSAAPGSFPDRSAKGQESDSQRQKRDWGLSVFRRDRKSAADGAADARPATVHPTTTSRVETVANTDPQTQSDVAEDGGSAVVQANRSLSLAKASPTRESSSPRPSFESSTPIAYSPYQRGARTDDATDTPLDSGDTDRPEVAAVEETNSRPWHLDEPIIPMSPRTDETTPPPADVDEVSPVLHFHDVAGQPGSSAAKSIPADTHVQQGHGWPVGAIVFGICAAVAVFWYRRGAT